MSKVFMTSDLHYFHRFICEYTPFSRGHFSSIEEMNSQLISNWNSVVTDNDLVYMLGDFAFAGTQKIQTILEQLNRRKLVMIKGNHDAKISNKRWVELGFDEVHEQLQISYKNKDFLLCHFPYLLGQEGEDTRYLHKRPEDKGLTLLHGHLHSTPAQKKRLTPKGTLMYDVGVDSNYLMPVSLEQICEELFYVKTVTGSSVSIYS